MGNRRLAGQHPSLRCHQSRPAGDVSWRSMRLVVLAISAALGCVQTQADFTPYSATSVQAPVTSRAVFAYAGDVETLREAHGVLVGTIAVAGNTVTSRGAVRERALEEAASLGGTHVFIASEAANTQWTQVSGGRAVTTVYGNTAVTTVQPGAVVPATRQYGNYIVVRVRPEYWGSCRRSFARRRTNPAPARA